MRTARIVFDRIAQAPVDPGSVDSIRQQIAAAEAQVRTRAPNWYLAKCRLRHLRRDLRIAQAAAALSGEVAL